MRPLLVIVPIVLAVILPYSAITAGKKYVSIPDASWDELRPYMWSHVVPWLDGREFHVYVCSEQVLRETVVPYDETLGSFAKVLLFEGLRKDPRISSAISENTALFRARVDSLDASERAKYREVFWERLAENEDFLPRLKMLFEKTRTRGTLRCAICEEDASFKPAGLQ